VTAGRVTAGARVSSPAVLVGLMSGTSLDGISAAVVRFRDREAASGAQASSAVASGSVDAELLAFHVHEYDHAQRERLQRALTGGTPADYCRLHVDLGGWLADAALAVLAESGVRREDVAAIASHGQTVWHEPGHSTWQTGDASTIAERTGLPVVSDFRARDVAAGGQGAPLVPVADALLFAGEGWRALQNLGGIGNVTVVPPAHALDAALGGVRAFDTGPGVGVIDAVVRARFPELRYDDGGRLALAGQAITSVVDSRLAEPYFLAPPPKSTGRELFSAEYVRRFLDACLAARSTATSEDLIATAVALTARSVADAYRRFMPEPVREVLLSGGGARNDAIVAGIREELSRGGAAPRVAHFSDEFFDGEAKEAVAFALLGYLHLRGRPGNVPGATGARGSRLLGTFTPA
jgi:anhydro-N-acetylmuramic acid kinase